MKFKDLKVGMKVKANKKSNDYYLRTSECNEYVGEIIKINYEKETFSAKTVASKLDFDLKSIWDDLKADLFEPYGKSTKITTMNEIPLKVTHDRDTIYVIYNNKVVAKATCSKDDNFNDEFGLNLALRRFCKTLCSENTTKKVIYNTDKVEDFI